MDEDDCYKNFDKIIVLMSIDKGFVLFVCMFVWYVVLIMMIKCEDVWKM